MSKKLLLVLCCMVCLLFVTSKSYASYTSLVEVREDAKIPFLFTKTFTADWDIHHSANNAIGGVIKVDYVGITEIPVRPYITIGLEKDKYNQGSYSVESKTYMPYGMGVEGIIKEWDDISLFGDASVTYSKHKYKKYEVNGIELLNSDKKVSAKWGVMLGVSKTINLYSDGNLKPYIGCEYFHVNSVMPEDKSNRDQVAPVLGTVWKVNKSVAIELESSFYNKSLSLDLGTTIQF